MMDAQTLGRLIDRHGPALTLYARQWCAEPEDIVQDAFLKLVSQKPEPVQVVPWLYRVVRNAAISALRANQRRRRHETAAARRTSPWFHCGAATALDADAATRALQALPIDQREVIVAHLWGGLSFEQIAAVTGVSDSTAHRWYLAGLVSLRERLGIACPNHKPTMPI